jgi:hypothetical protein
MRVYFSECREMVPGPVVLFGFLYAENIVDCCGQLFVATDVGANECSYFLDRPPPHVVKDQNSAHVEHAVGAEEIHQGVVKGVGAINVDVVRFDPLLAQVGQGGDRGSGMCSNLLSKFNSFTACRPIPCHIESWNGSIAIWRPKFV